MDRPNTYRKHGVARKSTNMKQRPWLTWSLFNIVNLYAKIEIDIGYQSFTQREL
jgi:hypothetical protein